jgi:hypothetical protein
MVYILIGLLAVIAVAVATIALGGVRTVPTGKIGIVYRRYGQLHPQERFHVRVHGSPGPQATVLRPNRVWLAPWLYSVRFVDQVYVPNGTIGLVEARVGAIRERGQLLCRYVECDYFQDGDAFLTGGGEMGRQPALLPGGASYSINPELFKVSTVENVSGLTGLHAADLWEVSVPVGSTGVVIALDGQPSADDTLGPAVPGHRSFQLPWVFLESGGQRGVQEETLAGGGTYLINPWFARVVLVPTRDLVLEWSRSDRIAAGDLNAALPPIVVNIEGHRLAIEMTQTLRIPPDVAPRLVQRFGEPRSDAATEDPTAAIGPVQRFVERVLGPTVAGYFTELASKYKVIDFIAHYDEVRLELENIIRQALWEWGVVAGRTVLAEFTAEDQGLSDLLRRIAAVRAEREILEYELSNAHIRADVERVQIELDGELKVEELRRQIDILGYDQVALERFLRQLARIQVPLFVSGANVPDELLSSMPFVQAREILLNLFTERGVPRADLPPQQIERSADPQGAHEDPDPDGS